MDEPTPAFARPIGRDSRAGARASFDGLPIGPWRATGRLCKEVPHSEQKRAVAVARARHLGH